MKKRGGTVRYARSLGVREVTWGDFGGGAENSRWAKRISGNSEIPSSSCHAAPLLPALMPLADPLRPRTLWSFAFRYPLAEGAEEPEPTVAEIQVVLDQIAALRAAVLRSIDSDRVPGAGAGIPTVPCTIRAYR